MASKLDVKSRYERRYENTIARIRARISCMRLRAKAILTGLSTCIPGYDYMRPTGGTGSARYCYSVWLRHLILAHAVGGLQRNAPKCVAELGPGDSIGVGVAALLSGVEKYYALDLVRYSDLSRTLAIFEELVLMFRKREPVPSHEEFPFLNPRLDSYEFPRWLMSDEWLDIALDPGRVAEIRSSIAHAGHEGSRILYQAPWDDPAVIKRHSVDMIYSQAVLEHVDDLSGVYGAMRSWLKPAGLMSHQIDYRCHGKADTWNGHWTYSDLVWKVIVGRRPYLLNRAPHSEHIRRLRENGFAILSTKLVHSTSSLRRTQLAARFRELCEEDLTTSGAFVLSIAPKSTDELPTISRSVGE